MDWDLDLTKETSEVTIAFGETRIGPAFRLKLPDRVMILEPEKLRDFAHWLLNAADEAGAVSMPDDFRPSLEVRRTEMGALFGLTLPAAVTVMTREKLREIGAWMVEVADKADRE